MAEAKKTKRGEIKIAEPLSKFSNEMKANIEKMLKMAHKTIDKRLTGLEKYFEKAKRDNSTSKKTTSSLTPAKAAKKVKAKASKVAKKVKTKTSKVAKAVKAKVSKGAKVGKAKTSKGAKAVRAKVGNTPKKVAHSSKKRAKQKK
ncbi:MAG TPA: hypothetical protein VNK03_02815 [Gammaproteobacteria bacterium]|nr:hypothetical protein [Gammaproteobacteria bacterium]